MQIVSTAQSMTAFAQKAESKGFSIGFVPTMGALHKGHASLIKASKSQSDITVVSVFVNPTQFNEQTDLDQYPRTFEQDRDILNRLGVDVMFFPSVDEIYPNKIEIDYELDGLDKLMEGPNRPGHFNGVVQVVTRLFDIALPSQAFFGEKDFQQLSIIKHMSSKLGYNVKIIGCPTVREEDGLAMSSRNIRLTQDSREVAPIIYRTLRSIQSEISEIGVEAAKLKATNHLKLEKRLSLEYLELVDPVGLRMATDESEAVQACVAARLGEVRLIDNLRVK